MNKEKFELIVEIAERAEELGLLMFDRFSLIMDLEVASDEFNLRLEQLLNADKSNFIHDICGIQNNINRQTKKFENFFIPRYSGQQ